MKPAVLACVLLILSTTWAQAEWGTTTEDDIFTDGGKVVRMLGLAGGGETGLLFECSSSSGMLALSFLQRDKTTDGSTPLPGVTLLVKPDQGSRWEGEGNLQRRNANYMEVAVKPVAAAETLLREIGEARRTIAVGVDVYGEKLNVSLSASGSTKAVKALLAVCHLDETTEDTGEPATTAKAKTEAAKNR